MTGLLRSRSIVLLLGLVVGAAAGVAVFQGSRLTGQALFVLAGATAGIVAAAIYQVYSRTLRLNQVTVTIPQISELSFSVNRDDRRVAWKLYVEAVTRISTQSLPSDSGSLREAMTSLYGLFAITRGTLKEQLPSASTDRGPTVEHLAIALLNNELRPFLARWHPELRRWEAANQSADEHDWPLDQECRAALVEVQERLVAYVLAFGRLAGFDQRTAEAMLRGRLGPEFTRRVPQQTP